MKRKTYERPAMKVVEMRQRCGILAGSGEPQRGANRQGYESEEW